MSSTDVGGQTTGQTETGLGVDMSLEVVTLPVADVDRAKAFYTEKLGFHADFDQQVNENLRFVQLTPPGSACSIAIGRGITTKQPGSGSLTCGTRYGKRYRCLKKSSAALSMLSLPTGTT